MQGWPVTVSMYKCAYNCQMNYQWDKSKAASNLRKHSVDFADAVSVFADELAITIEDKQSTEERYIILGSDAFGRILVVVYTWRESDIRIISARKATRTERRQYTEE